MTDPKQALEACRKAGFIEGQLCRDVRAGHVRVNTLDPQLVTFTGERGDCLPIGDATDLLESYQKGGIEPVDSR